MNEELQEKLVEYLRDKIADQRLPDAIRFLADAFRDAGHHGCADYLTEWARDVDEALGFSDPTIPF